MRIALSPVLSPMNRQRRVALVLGGGGILGAAYEIGALAALEEEVGPLPSLFDIFVGTSAGSFVAAVVSQGISARTLYEATIRHDPILHIRPDDVYRLDMGRLLSGCAKFCQSTVRAVAEHLRAGRFPPLLDVLNRAQARLPVGFLRIDGLDAALCRIFHAHGLTNRFSGLDKKLLIPALDIEEGVRAVFGENPDSDPTICEAVTASSAIPRLFGPVRIGDRYYVDGAIGGIANLDVPLRHGATDVLAVNPIVLTSFPRCEAGSLKHHSRCVAHAGLGVILDQCLRIEHGIAFHCAYRWATLAHPDVRFLLHQPDRSEMHAENSMNYEVHERVLRSGYRAMALDLASRREIFDNFFSHHQSPDVLAGGVRA